MRRAGASCARCSAPALSLAFVGTIVTAMVTGLAAAWLFDLSTLEGLLLGAILSATDGAAIFAVLRGSTLRRRLAHVLEGEAGFNDPVAVLLVVGFIEWIQHPDYGLADMTILFVEELAIGVVVGLLAGRLAIAALRRVELASRRPLPGADARGRRARVRRRGIDCTARASWPSTSPVLRSATHRSRRSARSSPSTKVSRGSRRSACS